MMLRRITRGSIGVAVCLAGTVTVSGCNSIINGWLSPIELGAFHRETTLEIRGSLSIQDTPRGVRGASEPTPLDLEPTLEEYRLVAGDVVNVFITGLRQRSVESAAQAVVDNRGLINLPVLGWLPAVGKTAEELEQSLRGVLADREIIKDAEVLVQFAAQRGLTYTIFGNESLAVRLNRGPGVFPIPRPDFRLLDALSQSGGLSELVTEIYVFRNTDRDRAQADAMENPPPGAQLRRDEASDEDEGHATPGVTQRSLSFSSGMNHGRAMLTGVTLATAPDQQESSPQESTPADQETASAEHEDLQESPPPDVQEILDLMLSGSKEAEAPPVEGLDDGELPKDAEIDQAAPLLDHGDSGSPTKWVFLNGEWIEVAGDTPEPAEPVLPVMPDIEDSPVPAIDWEAVAGTEQRMRTVRIAADALRRGDPRYNIVVRAGDVIRLFSGDIGFYYVTGHVRRPGVYTFRSGATVTLKNAMAAAAGLDALGWPDRVTIYRRIGEREQMLQVNLDRIYAGLEPDFYLKKDDIVNVGTHPFAPFLFQIRNLTIPQMGGSITYFYRYVNQKTKFATQTVSAATQPGLFP